MNNKIFFLALILIGLCFISFLIGKGYANSKCDYVEGLAVYGYDHCMMYDSNTDPEFHKVMNTTDINRGYSLVCSD